MVTVLCHVATLTPKKGLVVGRVQGQAQKRLMVVLELWSCEESNMIKYQDLAARLYSCSFPKINSTSNFPIILNP